MHGTLKRLGDTFGFFDTPDGDVYVRRSDLPHDARNGDRYELEAEDRGGRNPVAVNLRFLSHGAPADARRSRDGPERNRESKISVTIHPDEDGEVRDFPEGQFYVLPVTLDAKRGSGPYPGLVIKFFVDGSAVDQDFTTDGSGHTSFDAYLPPDTKRARIVAVAKDGDREIGVFSVNWKKPEPKPAVAGYIKADAQDADGTWTLIRIYTATTKDAEGIKALVTVRNIRGIEVEGVGSGAQVAFDTEDNGFVLKKVRFTQPGKGKVTFELTYKPSVEDSVEIETKAEETCQQINAELVAGPPGYRSTLKVKTFAATGADAPVIAAEIEIESIDEMIVEINGTEHRGKLVSFSTDTTGTKVVKIVFVAPVHYGHVNLYSKLKRSVCCTDIFVRHPRAASRP